MCAVMSSVGDNNGGNKPIKRNSLVDDHSDSETHCSDSQISSATLSGNAHNLFFSMNFFFSSIVQCSKKNKEKAIFVVLIWISFQLSQILDIINNG